MSIENKIQECQSKGWFTSTKKDEQAIKKAITTENM